MSAFFEIATGFCLNKAGAQQRPRFFAYFFCPEFFRGGKTAFLLGFLWFAEQTEVKSAAYSRLANKFGLWYTENS